MTAADAVTIMRCAHNRRATKRITLDRIDGYDAGTYFSVDERQVDGLEDLAAVLDQAARDPRSFAIRGEPLPGIDRKRCRRLLHPHEDGTSPTFREVPRRWAVIDFDNVPGPYPFDPRDGTLASEHCRGLLPEPWRRASYWWALSSSAGFKPNSIRIKLAFWLDRPTLGNELERHLKGCPIDASTLRTVQPIYVARPLLVGVADPIRQRTGLAHDIHGDTVTLPELPPEAARAARETHSSEGRRYVSGSSSDVAQRRLAALCRAIERAAIGGRHRCLMWASARAIELDDALPREVIATELITAARRAGLDDDEADLVRQVRNGFRLGIFGTEAA